MDQHPVSPFSKEQEIDLIELIQKIWKRRRFILKTCGIGAVIGLIVAFSIPKEYETAVKLSPETINQNKSGQLDGLAAMAGINLKGMNASSDALTVELYPDIINSTPFLLELVDITVENQGGTLKTTLYDYMQKYQKQAWWNYVISAPFDLLNLGMSLVKGESQTDQDSVIDPFKLTKQQESFISRMGKRIFISVDKKSGAISASVIMQDPLVSATIMQVVLSNLQKYITDYRTRKAKYDLAFTEKLYNESEIAYYKAQKIYASFIDANKNIVSARFATEEERLRNEMNLAFNVYVQMSQQLDVNKIKVQEVTPVYTVIEPARVALRASKPNKLMILIGFIFFAGLISVSRLLVKDIMGVEENEKIRP